MVSCQVRACSCIVRFITTSLLCVHERNISNLNAGDLWNSTKSIELQFTTSCSERQRSESWWAVMVRLLWALVDIKLSNKYETCMIEWSQLCIIIQFDMFRNIVACGDMHFIWAGLDVHESCTLSIKMRLPVWGSLSESTFESVAAALDCWSCMTDHVQLLLASGKCWFHAP